MKNILSLFIISLIVSSCSYESEVCGFRTNDTQFTKLFYIELKKQNVPYTVDNDGFINCEKQDITNFENAKSQVNRILYEGTGSKPSKKEDQEFLVSLLKKNNLEYYLLEKDDGVWVKWYPENEKHRQEIMLQVVENNFSKQLRESSDCKVPCNKASNK